MSTDKSYVEIRRRIAATPEKVFAAFAEAKCVVQWLSPSPDIKLTLLKFHFHEGGSYRFAYQLPDGRTVIVGGYYRAIVPPSKIVFSWIIEPPDEHAGIESEVTVTITADGAGTELAIRHEKLTHTDAITRHAEGWRGALDQLAAILEAPERVRGG
jgi:uncharacterized protein YndB with AHSA1/START domain